MSYESYKILHFAAIFLFLAGASGLLLARPSGKLWKMVTGIAGVVILVAGFGLLATTGHGFPLWIQMKLVVWLVVMGLGHVVAKRFPAQAVPALWITLALAIFAASLAVLKPV